MAHRRAKQSRGMAAKYRLPRKKVAELSCFGGERGAVFSRFSYTRLSDGLDVLRSDAATTIHDPENKFRTQKAMMMYSIVLATAGLAAQAAAACSRAALQEVAAAYVRAQADGKPTLLSLATNTSYAENDKPLDIAKGVLSQPITIDFNRSIYDTTQCATFTELTAATSKHPYVIATRILLDDDASKITKIESVVTDSGDWAFNATGHLYWTRQEKWEPVPEAQRDTRAAIQAAGDAYLNQWGNSTLPVPLGTPCTRLEGGAYTGQSNPSANTCRMGAFPQPLKVGDRRYIIDEELGAVDIFNGFPWLEATKPDGSVPSTNFIRVERGLIRYIHELTVCETPHCGR
ncbi:hypothetical protein ANO14919_092020 [Xylariales sp. No.14919]|nr:hypothetical protein ANO14919_092020 [Xylariales sp. No.14919]